MAEINALNSITERLPVIGTPLNRLLQAAGVVAHDSLEQRLQDLYTYPSVTGAVEAIADHQLQTSGLDRLDPDTIRPAVTDEVPDYRESLRDKLVIGTDWLTAYTYLEYRIARRDARQFASRLLRAGPFNSQNQAIEGVKSHFEDSVHKIIDEDIKAPGAKPPEERADKVIQAILDHLDMLGESGEKVSGDFISSAIRSLKEGKVPVEIVRDKIDRLARYEDPEAARHLIEDVYA